MSGNYWLKKAKRESSMKKLAFDLYFFSLDTQKHVDRFVTRRLHRCTALLSGLLKSR